MSRMNKDNRILRFNLWKLATVMLSGFLFVGLGVMLFQKFNNSQQSPVSITNTEANMQSNPEITKVLDKRINYDETAKIPNENRHPLTKQESIQGNPNNKISRPKPNLAQQFVYVSPPTEQPKPKYTFDRLKSLLQGQMESTVLNTLGKPISVSTWGNYKYWNYKNVAYDSVTGNISSFTSVGFDCDRYISNKDTNELMEAIIALDAGRDESGAQKPPPPKTCFVENINF